MDFQNISGGFLINPFPFSDPLLSSSNKMNVKISPFSMKSPDLNEFWATDITLRKQKKISSDEKMELFFTPLKNDLYSTMESTSRKSTFKKKLVFDDENLQFECPKKIIHKEENDAVNFIIKTKRTYSESTLSEKQNENNNRYMNIHKKIMENKEIPDSNVEITTNLENPDLPSILSETLNNLLSGNHLSKRRVIVIDTRFSFEYDAGHISHAININNPYHLENLFFEYGHLLLLKSFYEELNKLEKANMKDIEKIFKNCQEKNKFSSNKIEELEEFPPIIVIHCEFSQKRGPKLFRYLRKRDREINEENYPNLIYPHIFLLKGGYSQYVKDSPEFCTEDGGYVSMFNEKFKIQCNKENSQYTKSWNEIKNVKIITNFY